MSILTDHIGRTHDYLRISLTERCNLRCFYCIPEDGVEIREKSEFMTSEEVFEMASTFVDLGVKRIRLTGGEPLIKKDFAHILHDLSTLPVELGITTNGILVDRYIDTFKACGIKTLNVSLDSLQEIKFNAISKRKYFSKIMSNIELLLKEGFKVKLNIVLIKGTNDDEIIDFIKLTERENLSVRFIEFMPFIGNNWDLERTVRYEDIMDVAGDYFGENQIVRLEGKPNQTSSDYRVNGFKSSFGIIGTVTNPFCDSCNRIRLTADGKIRNCLFSSDETDLLTAHRKGENLLPLIQNALYTKDKMRGGIRSFDESELYLKNRSMTTIGG